MLKDFLDRFECYKIPPGPLHPNLTASMLRCHIKARNYERLVHYYFRCMRKISSTQLPNETKGIPVGENDSSMVTAIRDGNCGIKVNELYVENIITGCSLRSDTPYIPTCRQYIYTWF